MSKFLKLTAALTLLAAPAFGAGFGLGRTATEAEIAAWDIDVRPDGAGLPEGAGDVLTGEELFIDYCASCHGDFGEAVGRWPVLAGGQGSLTDDRPVKTVGSYWPYLSTVYDYVNRAMPFGNAQSLTNDEVYAITAYILYVNDIVDEDFELNHENFSEVRLPNEENFYPDDRAETELAAFVREPCMADCKSEVEITARARIVDVTPEESGVVEAAAEEAEAAATATAEAAGAAVEATAAAAVAAIDPELALKGEKVFRKCKSCHQIGPGAKHRTGPILTGIVGAPAGQVDGFTKYSKPLQAAAEGGLVWTEDELGAFLAAPKEYMKGTRMSFAGLKKQSDIDAIIAYLRSVE